MELRSKHNLELVMGQWKAVVRNIDPEKFNLLQLNRVIVEELPVMSSSFRYRTPSGLTIKNDNDLLDMFMIYRDSEVIIICVEEDESVILLSSICGGAGIEMGGDGHVIEGGGAGIEVAGDGINEDVNSGEIDDWSDVSSGEGSGIDQDEEEDVFVDRRRDGRRRKKDAERDFNGIPFETGACKDMEFMVGHIFDGHQQFKDALRDYIIRGGYNIKMKKNDHQRVTAVCMDGCPWRIHASKLPGQLTFMVKTLKNEHKCFRVANNKAANARWITCQLNELLAANPALDNTTMTAALAEWGVEPETWKLQRAKRMARESFQGTYADSYTKLQKYCTLLLQLNPGSTVKIQSMEQPCLDGNKIFFRVFICLHAMKEGFLNACRPFLGIDGCHLKGPYGGTLLAAISLDGNNGMFPIAWAIVDVENGSNWRWFLELLYEVIALDQRCKPLTIMTDGQKGLGNMVEIVFENAYHKRCARHLYSNLKSIFPGTALRNLFWAATRATTRSDFNKSIAEIKMLRMEKKKIDGIDMGPADWLQRIPTTKWSRFAFDHDSKSQELTNNVCEVFNNWIVKIRDKPIVDMLDILRQKMMVRLETLYKRAVEKNGRVCPIIRKRLMTCTSICRRCKLHPGRELEYEVVEGKTKYAVKLNQQICSCNMWQLSGVPCIHATACITHRGLNVEDFVDDYYTVEMWKKAYEVGIHPFPEEDLTPENENDKFYPPILIDCLEQLT